MQFNSAEQWPECGVYQNIEAEKYHAFRAASASALKAYARLNPRKAKHYLANFKDTEDTFEGHVQHTFMLEPQRFSKLYPIAQPCGAILGSGKNVGKLCGCDSSKRTEIGWRCGKHRDGDDFPEGITADLYERLKQAHDEIWRVAGDIFRKLGTGDAFSELTLIWIDPMTEELCKARLDIFESRPDVCIIYDLKKCQSAKASDFAGDVTERRYDVQAEWYRRGVNACMGVPADFRFIAVELNEDADNEAQVIKLDNEARQTGAMAAQAALEVYAACHREKSWPGYTSEVKTVSLRPYLVRGEEKLNSL